MKPRHHRAHRHLESGRDVPVRHVLDVEEDDGLPRSLVQIGEGLIETRKLLPYRGLALGPRRRWTGHQNRLCPGHYLPPPQQIETEPAGDGDEPWKNRPLWIESLEVEEGAHERVLSQILGVGGSEQSPAKAMHGSMEAPYQLVERRHVATVGATRKLELCPSIVRIESRVRCIVNLDDRSLLARRVRARPGDYFARRMKARAAGPPAHGRHWPPCPGFPGTPKSFRLEHSRPPRRSLSGGRAWLDGDRRFDIVGELREPGHEVAVHGQPSLQMHLHETIERWLRVAERLGRACEQRADGGRDRPGLALDLVRERFEEGRHFLRKRLEPRSDGRRYRREAHVETVADHGEQREEHSQGVGSETCDARPFGLRVCATLAPLEFRLVLEAQRRR